MEGAGDDVVVGGGEGEGVGAEDEGGGEGEVAVAEGGELDAAGAAGLPVLALGEDVDGVDGGGAEGGLEEAEEVVGRHGQRDVGHPQRRPLHHRASHCCPPRRTKRERES